MSWLNKIAQPDISIDLGKYPEKLRDYLFELSDFSQRDEEGSPFTYEEAEKDIQKLIQETETNMQKIVTMIQNAVRAIHDWNGSVIVIRVGEPPLYDIGFGPSYLNPVTDAHIQVGQQMAWGGAPDFTLFVNENEIIVEDILEAGDKDFFKDPKAQQDYFNLVREIRNPGQSTSIKTLILYTARPVKDRHLFENTNQVPSNLFLTSSYDRAEGISRDLSTGKSRDIWKIRIEERYLVNTLDTGTVQDYQIAGNEMVPVKSVVLLDPGEE